MSEKSVKLQIPEAPSAEHREAILAALVEYNRASGPPTTAEPVAILVQEDDDQTLGGLWGKTIYDWLHVELLVVPATMRGQGVGSRIIAQAEEVARGRGCIGVWLDTFSFQARGFYERLGYILLATIEDHPLRGARYILAKRLEEPAALS